MKCVVRFSRRALDDLQTRFNHIAAHNGEQIARKEIDRIIEYCESFDVFPERGTLRSDIKPCLRLVNFRGRVIIGFSYVRGVVTILRVFGKGQNVERAFKS